MPRPSDPHTILELVKLCGLNRRTVEKRLEGVSYTTRGRSRLYRLGDACKALVVRDPVPETVALREAMTARHVATAEKCRMAIDEAKKRLIPSAMVRLRAERAAAAAVKVAHRWAGKLTAGEVDMIVGEFESLAQWSRELEMEPAV